MQQKLDVFFGEKGRGKGLPNPKLSGDLVERLHDVKGNSHLWSTDSSVKNPYTDFNAYVKNFLNNQRKDFVLVGLSGSTPSSLTGNAYCYCYVTGDVACFFQIRWGNMNDNAGAQSSKMNGCLFQIQLMEAFIKEAKGLGLELPGERLLWVQNECDGNGHVLPQFCWVNEADHDLDALKGRWVVGNKCYAEMMKSIPGPHTIPANLRPSPSSGRSVEQARKE